jgi:hypothetical protein
VQATALLAIVAAAVFVARSHHAAVALAALAPVAFLLTNRVFSPQYLVTFVAAWAVAASLLARSARDQLLLGALLFGATLANYLVYPTNIAHRIAFSGVLFLLAFAATGWVLIRARDDGRPLAAEHRP